MRPRLGLLVLLLLVPLAGAHAWAREGAWLRVGTARVDLTPEGRVPLGGYAGRGGRSTGEVHDPVVARAVVLRTPEASVALVSVELVGVSAALRDVVRERTRDLDLDDVVLCATHTHAGPGALSDVPLWRPAMGAFDRGLAQRTAARVEAAIRFAAARLEPVASFRLLRAEVVGLQRNRAVEDGPVDPVVRGLELVGDDGRTRVRLVHFAAHPTLLGEEVRTLSGDWPGALARGLEAGGDDGAPTLVLGGAMGDVSPVAPPSEDPHARVAAYAERLAAAVRTAERSDRAAADDALAVGGTRNAWGWTVAGALLGRDGDAALAPARPWPLPVARLRIGPVDLVTVPGEPTVEVGRRLGQSDVRWVVSCAQDHLGYFADRALFRRGGYEADLSLFGPDAADRLAEAAEGTPPEPHPPRAAAATPGPHLLSVPFGDPDGPRRLGEAHGAELGGAVRDLLLAVEPRLVEQALGRGAALRLGVPALAVGRPARDLVVPALVRQARRLQRHVPPALLDEMEGVARASGVPFDAVLLENVFVTLAEQTDPSAMLEMPARCTNLVAFGPATSMGQLVHASTLDWGLVEELRPRVTTLVMEPADGHPFATVTWPGMVGVLRALGAQGIGITEESCAAPDDTTAEGVPIDLLLRDVVQHASDLQDAVARLRGAPGTCGYKVTVSDGRELDARVVALTAHRSHVRRPLDGLLYGCDPLAPAGCFEGTCDPAIPRADGSSLRRYPVVRELVEPQRPRLRRGDLEAALAARRGGVLGHGTLLATVFEPQLGRFAVAARDGVDPGAGTLTWSTWTLGALLSPERRARYEPPWPVAGPGPVEVAPRRWAPPGVRVEAVTFTSAVRSGLANNDRFTTELFRPEDPKGVVILLPHWKEDTPAAQRVVAFTLAAKGLAVLLMPLPYQYDRAPPGVRSGTWTLSSDLARTREATFQGVADVLRASLWLEAERGFPPARQAVVGTSLGGHLAALTMGLHPDRFRAGAFLLAGANVVETFLEPNGVTDGVRRRLLDRDVTLEEALDLVGDSDPGRVGRPERMADVLLVAGDADPVVPAARVRALAEAWGGARVVWFEGGHYAIVPHLPRLLGDVADHLLARFEAR